MKLAAVSGWYVYGPCDRCGLTSYCETSIDECVACGLGRQSRNDNADGLLQIVDSGGQIAYDNNGLTEEPMPKLREIEVSYSRTVQVKQYEPETATCRLVAVYQDGEEETPEDLEDLSNRAQDEVMRALGLEDDGEPTRAAVHGGTTVTRVTENPSSPPASADTAGAGSRRTRSSGSSAQPASGSDAGSSNDPLPSAQPAATGRSRSRSTPSTDTAGAGQSDVNPSTASLTTSRVPSARARTGKETTSGTAPETTSLSEKKYKLTDVTKACSEVAERTKNPMIVLELLEEFDAKDGSGKCTLANQLKDEDYAEFIQLCAKEGA